VRNKIRIQSVNIQRASHTKLKPPRLHCCINRNKGSFFSNKVRFLIYLSTGELPNGKRAEQSQKSPPVSMSTGGSTCARRRERNKGFIPVRYNNYHQSRSHTRRTGGTHTHTHTHTLQFFFHLNAERGIMKRWQYKKPRRARGTVRYRDCVDSTNTTDAVS